MVETRRRGAPSGGVQCALLKTLINQMSVYEGLGYVAFLISLKNPMAAGLLVALYGATALAQDAAVDADDDGVYREKRLKRLS